MIIKSLLAKQYTCSSNLIYIVFKFIYLTDFMIVHITYIRNLQILHGHVKLNTGFTIPFTVLYINKNIK